MHKPFNFSLPLRIGLLFLLALFVLTGCSDAPGSNRDTADLENPIGGGTLMKPQIDVDIPEKLETATFALG